MRTRENPGTPPRGERPRSSPGRGPRAAVARTRQADPWEVRRGVTSMAWSLGQRQRLAVWVDFELSRLLLDWLHFARRGAHHHPIPLHTHHQHFGAAAHDFTIGDHV